jgi:hypothetical protein
MSEQYLEYFGTLTPTEVAVLWLSCDPRQAQQPVNKAHVEVFSNRTLVTIPTPPSELKASRLIML